MAKKKESLVTRELAEAILRVADQNFTDEGTLEVDIHPADPIEALADDEIEVIKERGGVYVKAWAYVRIEELPEELRKKHGLED